MRVCWITKSVPGLLKSGLPFRFNLKMQESFVHLLCCHDEVIHNQSYAIIHTLHTQVLQYRYVETS